jgi:hypothetical protein
MTFYSSGEWESNDTEMVAYCGGADLISRFGSRGKTAG